MLGWNWNTMGSELKYVIFSLIYLLYLKIKMNCSLSIIDDSNNNNNNKNNKIVKILIIKILNDNNNNVFPFHCLGIKNRNLICIN